MRYRSNTPLVTCPGCLSRAPWKPVDHTNPRALDGADVSWPCRKEDAQTVVFFDNAKPDRAMFKRVYDKDQDFTVFFVRDASRCARVKRGYQCNACADLEEGAC